MSNKPEPFNHEISVELARLIPEEVRDDSELLERYINQALDIGLRAMISASGSIDLTYVSKEFDVWRNAVSATLIGEESDFEKGLDEWLTDPEGTFQKAFDLSDPDSLLSNFMTAQTTDRSTHEIAMKALVEEIKDLVSKDAAPKQAKEMGDDFEDDIEVFLGNIKSAEDKVIRTGEEAIEGTGGVKKGDVGVLVGHPSANDLMITIEAKAGVSNKAYTLKGKDSIWNQMTKAMKTRPAKASIGVVNIRNVKKHKPWLENGRYQIVVAVDLDDMDFILLEIAFSLLRYRLIEDLSAKDSSTAEPKLDIAAFENLIKDIGSNSDTLQTMRSNLSKIGDIIDNQDSQVSNIERQIKSQVRQLKTLLEEAQSALDGNDVE